MQWETSEVAPKAATGSPRPSVAEQRFGRLTAPAGQWLRRAGMLPFVILLCVMLGWISPVFWTVQNWVNLLDATATLWIMAMGMTFVLLTAGFDLSVGSILASSGLVMLWFLEEGVPTPLAIPMTILAMGVIGAVCNGALIGGVGLNFFVVTLGTMSFFRGLLYVVTDGQTLYTTHYPLVQWMGNGLVGSVPVPIWLMILTWALSYIVLRYTNFGRMVYITGGNPAAARIVGIPVTRVLVGVYGISAALAALAGIVEAGRLASVSPTVGLNDALLVGAAVLLGGTSFQGGEGGVGGTAIGALFIGVLQDGLSLSGISSFWQDVITGAILILAVWFNVLKDRWEVSEVVKRAHLSPAAEVGAAPPETRNAPGLRPDDR